MKTRQQKITERLERFREAPIEGEPTFTASNIHYDASFRIQALTHGTIGLVHKMVRELGLIDLIDQEIELLKRHLPYHESDHVLNIAYNVLCGGHTLDDLELLRNNETYLKALGTTAIPDPTTAGDFCRRFAVDQIYALMEVINSIRVKVWKQQQSGFFDIARVDLDGVLVPTLGECKEGMDISYKGTWGYHALVASLANTQEPLFLVNRPGNRPSHEGAAAIIDKCIPLLQEAGFRRIVLRGDTDFALTANFDRWDANSIVKFVFGIDASENLTGIADDYPEDFYEELQRHVNQADVKVTRRERPENVKNVIVERRGYKQLVLESEDIGEFEYRPGKCAQNYRIVFIRKNIDVKHFGKVSMTETRYFFYITNDWDLSMEEVVWEANQRCNQENLGAQLLNGVHALRAPLKTLESNWAYMVITSLAWSLKAWMGLSLPETGTAIEKADDAAAKQKILGMEFRTFVNAMMAIPCQIIETGRKVVYRIIGWKPMMPVFVRLTTVFNC